MLGGGSIASPRKRLNEQIRITPIRLIDQNNVQRGIVPTAEALELAQGAGMDLVEMSPDERPPVCRILDWGKYQFEQSKKQKRNQGHDNVIKEIRLRPKTDTHDRQIKINRAKGFLEKGHRVQFTMLFRGRERAHADIGETTFRQIVTDLEGFIKVERPAKLEGRRMTMVLSPVKR